MDPIDRDGLTSPDLIVDVKEKNLHQADSLSLLLYIFLLTVTVLTIWLLKQKRVRFLHETGLALLFGLIMGAIVRYGVTDLGAGPKTLRVRPYRSVELVNNSQVSLPDILLLEARGKARESLMNKTLAYTFKGEVKDVANINQIDQKTTFDPEIFFNVLLPPIIFNAGYSMKKRFFFRNIGSILTLAFVGTTISTFVVGGIMFGFIQIFPHLSFFTWIDCVRFGALISATDPVTCLAIFNDLHVDVNLYAIVFGESVLNDAVAIVITRTLEDYEETYSKDDAVPKYMIFLKSVGEFIGVFGASFIVGSALGCATALVTKFTHIRNFPMLEASLFILMSYSTFLIAEVLGLTGIVAVLFCGICQAHYTYNNMSEESRSVTKQFFGLLNFMAENFIFSYVGVSIFTFPKHNFDPGFIFAAFVSIIAGRALNVYPLSFLLNLGRKQKISYNMQHMLFLTGLRGAIAFALAIRNTLTASRQVILTATLVIVIVTVIIGGASTVSLLTWLGIPIGLEEEEEKNVASERCPLTPSTSPRRYRTSSSSGVTDASMSGGEGSGNVVSLEGSDVHHDKGDKSLLAKHWSGFDTRFMKPLLTHSNPTLMETMPSCCLPLARLLTSTEQLMRHPAMMDFGRTQIVEGENGPIDDDSAVGSGGGASASGDNVVTSSPQSYITLSEASKEFASSTQQNSFHFIDSPGKLDKSGLPSHM